MTNKIVRNGRGIAKTIFFSSDRKAFVEQSENGITIQGFHDGLVRHDDGDTTIRDWQMINIPASEVPALIEALSMWLAGSTVEKAQKGR